MALQEQEVREQLKKVIDPELFVNIVDLGLIYVVDVITRDESTEEEPKYDIKIEMTMTSPMCPAGPQLVADSKSASMEIEGVQNVEVKVVMDPPWTQDMMTDDAKDQLGIFWKRSTKKISSVGDAWTKTHMNRPFQTSQSL